jgi:hypothetical protein
MFFNFLTARLSRKKALVKTNLRAKPACFRECGEVFLLTIAAGADGLSG